MKLEQYLAIGVTTGLKVLRPDNETILKINGIVGHLYIFNEFGKETYGEIRGNANKPICRPLSDLTKPIEYNGDVFVPIVRLAVEFRLQMYQFIDGKFYCNNYGRYIDIKELPFEVVLKLIEWHFAIGDFEFVPVTKEFNPYK